MLLYKPFERPFIQQIGPTWRVLQESIFGFRIAWYHYVNVLSHDRQVFDDPLVDDLWNFDLLLNSKFL